MSWIKSDEIRRFTEKAIGLLPDYFFEVAASSTGRYHPKYALGGGGLVRHTKAAVTIAKDLLALEMYGKYTQDEKDLILTSLILHDGLKHGEKESKYTIAEHPLVIANWISTNENLSSMLSDDQLKLLIGAISSHMGQFNTDFKSKKEILPKPKTAIQKMVHMCDYLASRKYLEFNFGDTYYNPEDFKDTTVDELAETINSIIILCKEKVNGGANKDEIYSIISENNSGKRNPNSITDLDVAKLILNNLNGYCIV